MFEIKHLDASSDTFPQELKQLLAWNEASDQAVVKSVNDIITAVKKSGDEAVVEFTNRFDCREEIDINAFSLGEDDCQAALLRIGQEQRDALQRAAERIQNYHQKQKQDSWQFIESDGTVLGQKITPLDRVGIYVPGGKASYPSSVLMNAIPAKVAGVAEVVMVVPAPGGFLNDMVLAAAAIAGVDKIHTIGGAQAIAALAYGTESISKVDKIVGPGNIYVATAKRAVFGQVGLDMIAGPSEILVICDGGTEPDWIAMDLFSQAEHDENAQSILLSPDAAFIDAVEVSMNKLLADLERKQIVVESVRNRAALIKVNNLVEAVEISNSIAPEHLELSVESPEELLPGIRHAGAVFMGRYTAEAIGDYCAGPNHVLPTSGTARFSSPLGVYDFQKRTSIIHCSRRGASELGKIASVLARAESLTAPAASAEYRIIRD